MHDLIHTKMMPKPQTVTWNSRTALKSLTRVPRPTEHCPSSQKEAKMTKDKTGSFFLQLILFCTKVWHALSQEWMCFWPLSLKKDLRVRDGYQKYEKEELPHKEKLHRLGLLYLYRIVWGGYNQDYRITRSHHTWTRRHSLKLLGRDPAIPPAKDHR